MNLRFRLPNFTGSTRNNGSCSRLGNNLDAVSKMEIGMLIRWNLDAARFQQNLRRLLSSTGENLNNFSCEIETIGEKTLSWRFHQGLGFWIVIGMLTRDVP